MTASGRVEFLGVGSSVDATDDAAPPSPSAIGAFATELGGAFERASGALERAGTAERAFTAGRGGLQEMVLERAQADIALQIATTAASRATQALSTILGMQV